MTDIELLALKKKQFFTSIKARTKSHFNPSPTRYGEDDCTIPPCHMKMLLERYGTRKDIDDHLNKETTNESRT